MGDQKQGVMRRSIVVVEGGEKTRGRIMNEEASFSDRGKGVGKVYLKIIRDYERSIAGKVEMSVFGMWASFKLLALQTGETNYPRS